MEKLTQDSDIDLKQHQEQVSIALADEQKAATADPAAGASQENPFVNELITAAVGGSILGAAMTIHQEMSTGSTGGASSLFVNKKKGSSALFVNGGGNGKAAHATVSIMPVKSQKEDLVSRTNITRMSLTGAPSSGGKPSPIKGIKATASAAKPVNAKWLLDELIRNKHENERPFEHGSKRLMEELKKGNDAAESFVRNNPTPKQQPLSPPAPVKSS